MIGQRRSWRGRIRIQEEICNGRLAAAGPSDTKSLQCCAGGVQRPSVIVLAASSTASAQSFPAGPIRIDPSHPFNPVQVAPTKIGPGIIIPSGPAQPIPSPPSVKLPGSGPIPNLVNRVDKIAHIPGILIQNGAPKIVEALPAVGQAFVDAHTWPFRVVGNFFDNLIKKAKEGLPTVPPDIWTLIWRVLLWLAIGVFAIVTLAVMSGSLLTAMILRRPASGKPGH
jgi:hypothetical protein